ILLQTFKSKCTLANIRQALEIEITARNDNDDPLAREIALLEILERIDAKRAGRFEDDTLDIEHLDDARAKPVFRNRYDSFRIKAFENLEVFLADLSNSRAIDEIVDMGKLDALACLKAAFQARRALW